MGHPDIVVLGGARSADTAKEVGSSIPLRSTDQVVVAKQARRGRGRLSVSLASSARLRRAELGWGRLCAQCSFVALTLTLLLFLFVIFLLFALLLWGRLPLRLNERDNRFVDLQVSFCDILLDRDDRLFCRSLLKIRDSLRYTRSDLLLREPKEGDELVPRVRVEQAEKRLPCCRSSVSGSLLLRQVLKVVAIDGFLQLLRALRDHGLGNDLAQVDDAALVLTLG